MISVSICWLLSGSMTELLRLMICSQESGPPARAYIPDSIGESRSLLNMVAILRFHEEENLKKKNFFRCLKAEKKSEKCLSSTETKIFQACFKDDGQIENTECWY